ncbi:hypothetical protein SBRCBS47491_000843 [Sporothrix bragantina]|uniref:TMEM1 family protein n=1 Tax=Sporothrix bragantina TaxID=671064 RepID=A0ABP0ATQ1_9PEZI
MEPFSTSKVSVEYHDPHGLYRLLAPGLAARLPLRHLHWQSHSGPLRSIDTLHVELVSADSNPQAPPTTLTPSPSAQKLSESIAADDGFQTASVGRAGSLESVSTNPLTNATATTTTSVPSRRHQIPGLRRTPYLKLLLVRCDDTDSYKAQTRAEIKDWIKKNTMPEKNSSSSSSKKLAGVRENHDAFEWMIVHVVLPNSPAYSQPRTSKGGGDSSDSASVSKSSTSRWGKNTSTLLERLRSDFNAEPSSKNGGAIVDRVAQIRVAVNEVPYDMLPKVAPTTGTVPTPGISASENEAAWSDVVDKLKSRILASFDVRVSQYEDDIREKDVQRTLPGWNFCTFFILKEGLARGFESVGLVEDALVGYDELSVGLDTVLQEQASLAGSTLLKFTDELKEGAQKALHRDANNDDDDSDDDDDETVDLQAASGPRAKSLTPSVPISPTKKAYRELILANNVSVFDFRCYIFARQVALLLRLGNAAVTRDELLNKMQEQTSTDVVPSQPPSSSSSASSTPENLAMLAEICRRTLEFVPAVSQVMREDLLFALAEKDDKPLSPSSLQLIDNMVASFAFSIAQQILAQTSTRALPIPLAMTQTADISEPKASIPEPKTMMHPARTSSLDVRSPQGRPPPSPGIFPGPGQPQSGDDAETTRFLKMGLEELAARRADLYLLSRNILQKGGEKRGWSDGWSAAPVIDNDLAGMEDVSLDDNNVDQPTLTTTVAKKSGSGPEASSSSPAGIDNLLLRTALESRTGFFRLYEALTDKAVRHYTVAGHGHAVKANFADLAVLKYHLQDYAAAVYYFYETTQFFGENSWGLLELSMLLMCAQCLKELGRKDEYTRWLLQFLTKAADAERQRREQQVGRAVAGHANKRLQATSSVHGRLADLLEASSSVPEMRVPLTSFFRAISADSPPMFADGQDRFTVTLKLESLLADPLPVDSVRVRLTQPSARGPREIWLDTDSSVKCTLGPGRSTVQLHSNTIVPGLYEIDQVRITAKNLVIFHDRLPTLATPSSAATTPSSATSAILPNPHIVLYQRTDALDVQLSTSKDLQLDKNNFLELALLTGWNDVQHCEMRIRAATGGLRLITTESKVVGSIHTFSKPVEGGIVCFDNVCANTTLRISFPFSIEQDVLELCLKVDVTYTTANGTFHFSKSPSVSTSLALGVNVQDVFKHNTLFSRFTVSTATASPLRVFRSQLLESDLFTAHLGGGASDKSSIDHSTNLPVVFPKQPVSLLYRIARTPASLHASSAARKEAKRTMYIKLHYSVFQDQLDVALEASLGAAFRASAGLQQFAKLAIACVLRHVHASLTTYDLEKMALLHEMQTSVLAHVHWAKEFPGLETPAKDLAAVIYSWQKQNPTLSISGEPAPDRLRTILIPVDIPSITIVHTADIQLQGPFGSAVAADTFEGERDGDSVGIPIFCVNQLLPATLHLRWTRIWDTSDTPPQDLEFSFEVSAPNDAWLIGGRRKGHFVIPAPDVVDDAVTDGQEGTIGLSSTPALEAAIPLMLIPLREGRLPYPSVEIREVVPSNSDGGHDTGSPAGAAASDAHHCETDYRNLGETVHVVADRTRLTLSLDASGPGGGPLVLESERARVDGRIVV